MRSLSLVALILASNTLATSPSNSTGWKVAKLQALGLARLSTHVDKNGYYSEECTLENVSLRREWGTLTDSEKKGYIAAVKCLSKLPPLTPTSLETGVRSRYDDFVLTHINQTLNIHGTGNFFAWHRYYIWTYEQALRNECGYTGYQPYMDWGKYAMDPENSPIFDGSATSMGSNGAFIAHDAVGIPSNASPSISIPTGNGGGCMTNGPFVDFPVNLGPCLPSLSYVEPNPRADCLGYNPRCIRRDISQWTSSRWTKDSDIADVIENYPDPTAWTYRFQGDFPAGYMGVHTAGHFTWGGDPGGDIFTSPADPVFFLHHAQVDRVYWIWQNQNVDARTFAVGATITINNTPPSRNASLDDTIDIGVNAGPITLRDAGSTIGNTPFCYIYL
ncbi:tyrosinase [Pseudovirgaria hyperparasitica]|uniref:Tyrosinase n=1 Tax=Pseudovirgaria hyperparasitica TaxID=470096 RepID=A0A6A6W082_9PEZI|nr:tyrosinase [Pseudovirgaria hyperparasitica]KAF2754987.1 tyrosinase [Pseudovirgaria hyperparasitica]